MKKVLVVYHTMTGGTGQMARAAAKGAASESEVQVHLIHAAKAGIAEMREADGYIFATPENLAMMSGVMKDFFDRTYYGILNQINGRPYAALICAGSDGENAARQITRIATGWRLKPIVSPLIICTHAQTPEKILAPKKIGSDDIERCTEVGATIAAGLAYGIY
jgi:multimeric flavodoxin WrbA